MNDQITQAVEVLDKGGIIVFPTDTAFGIGCRIDKVNAIEKLYEIRKRPRQQAVPVLVSDIEMAKNYALGISKEVKDKLIDEFWPGPLTIVLPSKLAEVPALVRGGEKNVGLRMPNDKTIIEIIKRTGVPILGPSANFHGEKTPYSLEDIDPLLLAKIDYLVKGECSLKDVSTVIDCSKKPWKILREGAIKAKDLQIDRENTILLINTSSNAEIEIGLEINGKKIIEKKILDIYKREVALNLIDKLLKEHSKKIVDLTEIQVVTGPGSFTGLRVGIAIANTISTLLDIPVNGKKIGDLENAVYN